MTNDNLLYSSAELAELFGMSRKQVVTRIRRLHIPHWRYGRGHGRGYYCHLDDFLCYSTFIKDKGTFYYAYPHARNASNAS